MADLVGASKTLKALGTDGEPLKCVEADPTEVQRMALKKVGKAAGPVVGMFVMGLFEYPRRKQKVLLDAVYAARMQLFAANGRDLFFRRSDEGAGGVGGVEQSVLNRRATDDGVGADVTRGTLAARKSGVQMLREYGLNVSDDEDLGNTRFELTVAGADVMQESRPGRAVAGMFRAPVGGVELPAGGVPDKIEGHAERVDATVREASMALGGGTVASGSASSSSSGGPAAVAGSVPNASRLRKNDAELRQAKGALRRLWEESNEATGEFNAAHNEMDVLFRTWKDLQDKRNNLSQLLAQAVQMTTTNVLPDNAPEELVRKRVGLVRDALEMAEAARAGIELIRGQIDGLKGRKRELFRVLRHWEARLARSRVQDRAVRERLLGLMRRSGKVYTTSIVGELLPGAASYARELNEPWWLVTDPGNRRRTYATNDRRTALQAKRDGRSVRELDDIGNRAAFSWGGHSRDSTWHPPMAPGASSGSTSTDSSGRMDPTRRVQQEGERERHDCEWRRIRQMQPTRGAAAIDARGDPIRDPSLTRCMRCQQRADYVCLVDGCGNATCVGCMSEVSMLLDSGRDPSSGGSSSGSSRGGMSGSGSSSSTSAPSRRVHFASGVGVGASGGGGGTASAPGFENVSSIAHQPAEGMSIAPGMSVRLSRVASYAPAALLNVLSGRGMSVAQRPNVINEKGMENIGAPPDGWDAEYKKVKHVDWKHGEQMSLEMWESLQPRVARDLYQQLGNHLYCLLTVWLGDAFNVLVQSVPNADGFGLYELLMNRTEVKDDEIANRYVKEWNDAKQGSTSEQRFEYVEEFIQTLKDIAEKFQNARGPESMCPVTSLGTALQLREKLLKHMAPRFNRITEVIQMDIHMNRRVWTNGEMIAAYKEEEKRQRAAGNKSFMKPAVGKRKKRSSEANNVRSRTEVRVTEESIHGRGRGSGADRDGTASEASGKIKCYECGELGHIARNCPNKNGKKPTRQREKSGAQPNDNKKQWKLKCFMCGGEHGVRDCKSSRKPCYLCGDKAGHSNRDCPNRKDRYLNRFEMAYTAANGICKLCGKNTCPGVDASQRDKCKASKLAVHQFQNSTLVQLRQKSARQANAAADGIDGGDQDEAEQGDKISKVDGNAAAVEKLHAKSSSRLKDAQQVTAEWKGIMACGGRSDLTRDKVDSEGGPEDTHPVLPDECCRRWCGRAEAGEQQRNAGSGLAGAAEAVLAGDDEREVGSSLGEASTTTRPEELSGGTGKYAIKRELTGTRDTNISTGSMLAGVWDAVVMATAQMASNFSNPIVGPPIHEANGAAACEQDEAMDSPAAVVNAAEEPMGTTANWSINTEIKVLNVTEALEHYDTLLVVAIEDPREFENPLDRPWQVGSKADLLSCCNTAGVQVPEDVATEADYVACQVGLAKAITRMMVCDYKRIAFDPLLTGSKDKRLRRLVEEAQVYRGAGALPTFMRNISLHDVMTDHYNSFEVPKLGSVKYLGLMSGVGGGALAAVGAGADPKKLVLNDVCEHHCAQLRVRFPDAEVICGDIKLHKTQARVLAHKGQIALMGASLNCQPGSDAANAHDPEDVRNDINEVVVALASQVKPECLVVEDVVGFRHNQPDAYRRFTEQLEDVFKTVEVVVCNAKHAMAAQNRNRLFFVCTDAKELPALMRSQVLRQKTCSSRTKRTMREALSPYLPDGALRVAKGVFIPHLKKAKRGFDGRPARIISLDTHSPTITCNYGSRGGLSKACFDRYSECDADFCTKGECLWLNPQLWGVLMGFSVGAKWSQAKSCDCMGCTTPTGRSKGRVDDIERGNAIVPAQALMLYRPLVRAIVRKRAGGALPHGLACAGCLDDAYAEDDAVVVVHGGDGMQSNDEIDELTRCGSRLVTWVCMGGDSPPVDHLDEATRKAKARLDDERRVIADERRKQHERSRAKRRAKAALHGREPEVDDVPADSKRQDSNISLAAAKKFIMRVHRVRGHRPIDLIQKDLRSGTITGPCISDEQFVKIKKSFSCSTCGQALARFSVKGHLHPWAEIPKTPKWVLSEVSVDVSGRMPCPSVVFVGDRGNQRGGGHEYFTLYRDAKTGRLFVSFITYKDDLEDDVAVMTQAMEIASKDSVDYDGRGVLRVGAWKSDRDSNLTSGAAVADMLRGRIEHRMAAADAVNQTPHLDNAMRRVIEMARAIRIEAGLPVEYWEFAVRYAVMMINRLGVGKSADPLGRSPLTRWTGRASSADGWHVFGCEAMVEYKSHEREGGKMGAVAPASNGRLRYVGPDSGPGFVSQGHRVLDTAPTGGGPPRLRVRKNCRFNEDMDGVRALPFPSPGWDVNDEEECYKPPTNGGRQEDEEPIDREADLRALFDRPSELTRVVSDEEPEEREEPETAEGQKAPREAEEIPEQEGSKRPRRSRRKGSARAERVRRAKEKVNQGKRAKKEKRSWPKLPTWSESQKIQCLQKNPKTKGDMCYERYERYKKAKTVREYLSLGGTKDDLRWDRRRLFVVAKGKFEEGEAHSAAANVVGDIERDCNMVCPELETARERYARQAQAFHAEREKDGTAPPAELPYNVRMLPFWEAVSAAEAELDAALSGVRKCAQEAACWKLSEAESDEAMVAEHVEAYREVAEKCYVDAMEGFEAAVSEKLKHKRAVDVPTPKGYDDAMKSEFSQDWQDALDAELDNLKQHKVYVWVPRPPGIKVLDSNWAWRVKPADDGSVAKLKVRLVGRGFRQIYGVHFFETFAPVGKLTTFRMMCAETARRDMEITFLDIRSAYLMADIPIPQYMSVPKGVDAPEKGMVWLLKKALYGMRDSAAAWHKMFRADLLEWGFQQSTADACLFTKREGDSFLRVLLFVDDLAIANDKTVEGRALKEWLKGKISDKYKFSTSPDDNVYLGMTLERTEAGHLVLTQKAYIERMMATLGFEGCRQVWTPSPGGRVSVEDCPKGDPKDNPDGKSYRERAGMMRWIEQCSRPDISATLSELCKVQINPGPVHVKMMDHLCRYINTTKSLGIVYGAHVPNRATGPLVMYVDSDWAGDPDTFYSRGGFQALAWQGPVSWSSYKMRAIANSSAQAEYMSMAMATREGMWLRYLLSDMGYGDLSCEAYGSALEDDYRRVRMKDDDPFGSAYTLAGDNKAALQMAKNPVHHKKGKHIHIAWNLTREEVGKGSLVPVFIPTAENPADLMTKSLAKTLHRKHSSVLLADYKDGKLYQLDGLPAEIARHQPTLDRLYRIEPPGFGKASDFVDKLGRVCTTDFEDGHDASAKSQRLIAPAAAATVMKDQLSRDADMSENELADLVANAVCEIVPILRDWVQRVLLDEVLIPSVRQAAGGVAKMVQAELGALVSEALISEEQAAALYDAILDSGASKTYVTKKVRLDGAVPGSGFVKVATGRRERVSESGDLGPLKGAEKVDSFARTLVSVMDVAEQVGAVEFTPKAAFVTNEAGGVQLRTQIATATKSRLYKFDVEALEDHVERLKIAVRDSGGG